MNHWKLSLIEKLVNVKNKINIQDEVFDYLKIVDLNKVKYENTSKNVLYFFTYSEEKDLIDEFIINAFDLRKYANEIISKNKNFTYVIDEETWKSLNEENKNAKLIIVDNILESINKLYNYIIANKTAKVIAITGSVGKTTATGMIENVLKQKYNVLRIYSKRITPIILKANIINFLTPDTQFVVLEMSIFHKDHVEILSDLLNPDISALIGVDSSHLEYFDSIMDICKWKASIFRYAKDGFYNNLDELVSKLSLNENKLYLDNKFIYKTNLEKFIAIATDYELKNDTIIINKLSLKLFYNSKLSIIQTLLAYKIGILCHVPAKDIAIAINNYIPVENRLQTYKVFNKEIIFDGDITTNERIKQLASHNYDKCYLIIRKFGSAENNKRFEKVLDSLDKFTKVYVFNDVEYLEMLRKHPKVEIVDNHDFLQKLNGKIIYHYSGYYRSFDVFSENNLKTLENEKYKILKPEEI